MSSQNPFLSNLSSIFYFILYKLGVHKLPLTNIQGNDKGNEIHATNSQEHKMETVWKPLTLNLVECLAVLQGFSIIDWIHPIWRTL